MLFALQRATQTAKLTMRHSFASTSGQSDYVHSMRLCPWLCICNLPGPRRNLLRSVLVVLSMGASSAAAHIFDFVFLKFLSRPLHVTRVHCRDSAIRTISVLERSQPALWAAAYLSDPCSGSAEVLRLLVSRPVLFITPKTWIPGVVIAPQFFSSRALRITVFLGVGTASYYIMHSEMWFAFPGHPPKS